MRLLFLIAILTITPQAAAQQVYKCTRGNDVAYQSEPCAPTQRTVKQWDATPEPFATPAPATRPVTGPAPTRTIRSRRAAGNGARTKVDPADARCAKAKARRESRLKAVGLKRNFDLLRQLDEAVYEACR
ncbi:MAG: hypothetical protein EON92_01855 [Burkholderiales bacterium]|nr:MAG: hypothetical protein EON92_01855 [Burkholderiales bacterium]